MNLNGFELSVSARKGVGSPLARGLLKGGMVPLVVYGKNIKSFNGMINLRELEKALASKTLFNKFTNLNYENGKEKSKFLVFAKVVQKEPVKDKILHIDFQAVEKGSNIKMKVPVRFNNKELCESIKLGGFLNIVSSYVELIGKVEDMPAYLDYDLQDAQVGVSIKTHDLSIPNNVKVIRKYEDKVIATLLAPRKKAQDAEQQEESADSSQAA